MTENLFSNYRLLHGYEACRADWQPVPAAEFVGQAPDMGPYLTNDVLVVGEWERLLSTRPRPGEYLRGVAAILEAFPYSVHAHRIYARCCGSESKARLWLHRGVLVGDHFWSEAVRHGLLREGEYCRGMDPWITAIWEMAQSPKDAGTFQTADLIDTLNQIGIDPSYGELLCRAWDRREIELGQPVRVSLAPRPDGDGEVAMNALAC